MLFSFMLATNTLLAGELGKNPESERYLDSMTIFGPDGNLLRLPDHSTSAAPIRLLTFEGFEIRGEPLLPIFRRSPGGVVRVPRFAIRIAHGNRTIYHRRYASDEATLGQASAAAIHWIRRRKLSL